MNLVLIRGDSLHLLPLQNQRQPKGGRHRLTGWIWVGGGVFLIEIVHICPWPPPATSLPQTQSTSFPIAWLFIFLTMDPSPEGWGHSGSVIIPPIRCQGGTNGGYSLSNGQWNGLLTETEWRHVSLVHHIVQFLFPLSCSCTKVDFCLLFLSDVQQQWLYII